MVPVTEDETLPAKLIKEVYTQASTAHPGLQKTKELVKACYY